MKQSTFRSRSNNGWTLFGIKLELGCSTAFVRVDFGDILSFTYIEYQTISIWQYWPTLLIRAPKWLRFGLKFWQLLWTSSLRDLIFLIFQANIMKTFSTQISIKISFHNRQKSLCLVLPNFFSQAVPHIQPLVPSAVYIPSIHQI